MSTPRPPYTVEELENTPYTGRDVVPPKLRFVFVVSETDACDCTKVVGVYASEEAANKAASYCHQSVDRVLFYEH